MVWRCVLQQSVGSPPTTASLLITIHHIETFKVNIGLQAKLREEGYPQARALSGDVDQSYAMRGRAPQTKHQQRGLMAVYVC